MTRQAPQLIAVMNAENASVQLGTGKEEAIFAGEPMKNIQLTLPNNMKEKNALLLVSLQHAAILRQFSFRCARKLFEHILGNTIATRITQQLLCVIKLYIPQQLRNRSAIVNLLQATGSSLNNLF